MQQYNASGEGRTRVRTSRVRTSAAGRKVGAALVPTPGVRNLIREAKNHQIDSAMQTGGKFGMQTMDAALVELVRRGHISREEAEKRSSNPEELRRLAGGSGVGLNAGGYASGSAVFGGGR